MSVPTWLPVRAKGWERLIKQVIPGDDVTTNRQRLNGTLVIKLVNGSTLSIGVSTFGHGDLFIKRAELTIPGRKWTIDLRKKMENLELFGANIDLVPGEISVDSYDFTINELKNELDRVLAKFNPH